MESPLEHTVALLSRTPATLNALLRNLPEEWTSRNEGANTWTPFDVVAHLVSGEKTDWMPRVRILLESGESRPFDPFDMDGHRAEGRGKSLARLLDEFSDLRLENLDALRALNLRRPELDLRGTHPALGTVTLAQLINTWAAHDLTHLHQISRIMAHQLRDAVGPWEQYLGVLHCTGHSSR